MKPLAVGATVVSLLSGCAVSRVDPTDWRLHGVRIVHGSELDPNTPQTQGMTRAAAITHAMAGANKLWAGTVIIHPKAVTGAHHHGELESVIYVISGHARMRWGDRLEFMQAGAASRLNANVSRYSGVHRVEQAS